MASFMLKKSASFLSDHMWQLENDIFSEIPFSSTKVLPETICLIKFELCCSVSFTFINGTKCVFSFTLYV